VLDSVQRPLSDTVLQRLADGSPSRALLDGWHALESAALREPEALAEALAKAADLDISKAFASLAPAAAFGVAVVGVGRRVCHIDETFRAWFGDPWESPAFRRLIQLAMKSGQASGLVDALDGAAIAACAGGLDAARRWPLPQAALDAARGAEYRIVLLGFAPSRASDLAARAAQVLGLTPLESRVAEAMLDAPSVQVAAERIGVGYETAREALKKIQKKIGAARTSDVVRRLMTLMCGDLFVEPDLAPLMISSLGATPAEARVGAAAAQGLSAGEIAERLGVKAATIRGQLKALYAKAGVARSRDLVRIVTEAGALAAITDAAEVAHQPESVIGRLRVAQAAGGRQVAFWDYGPRGARPVLVPHGTITGRTLPPAFVTALQRRGWRPIVPQRPGFGLSDIAAGDYLEGAADDMAAILDALRIERARILARDDSAAAALAFAARHPHRVTEGMLANPRLPGHTVRSPHTVMGAVTRTFLAQPDMVGAFAEMLRRQTRTDLMRDMVRRSASNVPADAAVLAQPGVLTSIVRDIQAMAARSSRGFAQEQGLYARGWRPPAQPGGARWLVMECAPMASDAVPEIFAALPNARFTVLPEAGLLLYYSHPEEIAALLDGV
jgi:pimeloyl-ACP methyl ester carboxylesterase/DNA-binding CsgD family transcriptional regulator